jgi:hypothetical protein
VHPWYLALPLRFQVLEGEDDAEILEAVRLIGPGL